MTLRSLWGERSGQWLRLGKAGRGKKHYIVKHHKDGVMESACGLSRRNFRPPCGAKYCQMCIDAGAPPKPQQEGRE